MDTTKQAQEEATGNGDEISEELRGVMRMDRMRSNDIRGRLKQEDVLETV